MQELFSILHDVLNLPFLPHLKESAKLSYILAVERSVDPIIVQLRHSLLSNVFQDAPDVVFDAVSAAKSSVSNIHSSTFKSKARTSLMFAIGIPLLNH